MEQKRNLKPLLIKVTGTHRELGRQIGQVCAAQIQHNIESAQAHIESAYDKLGLNWEGARIQASKYLPFVQEQYPQYMEEMIGLAQGANVAFEDIVTINAMEAVTIDALHLTKCTSLAVNDEKTANGHVLVAHNEDWVPEDEADVFVVHATLDDEPPFLAMTYGGLLPNVGFNAAGIAQCCDSVYPSDSRVGLPRIIVSRAVLAAQTPAEAINRTLAPRRAAGYNHLLVHESGEIYCVEASANRFAILYGHDGYLVHTNHYQDTEMRKLEHRADELINSRVRYFRALRLLRQSDQHSIESLMAIQQDHVNYPSSICNHAVEVADPLSRQKTINALIIDLNDRVMHLAWGNPCQSRYHTFQLET